MRGTAITRGVFGGLNRRPGRGRCRCLKSQGVPGSMSSPQRAQLTRPATNEWRELDRLEAEVHIGHDAKSKQ